MKPGSKIILISLIIVSFFFSDLSSENKITTTPLMNLDQIKPSYEATDEKNENINSQKDIKKKKKEKNLSKSSQAVLIGLDKITAKSSKITLNINEAKKFGPLEIKILKCGKIYSNNKYDNIAYMQVKDVSKNDNEKVFIFNGWTFSSDPSLKPFDHAIYDLQLLNCYQT